MTAKEMAHWERWQRRGRRQFQWTYTMFVFAAIGIGPLLIESLFGGYVSPWWEKSLFSALVSVGTYFLYGWVWNAKIAEYRRANTALRHVKP